MPVTDNSNIALYLSKATGLWKTSRYQEAIDYALEVCEQAKKQRDEESVAQGNLLIGKCYMRLGSYDLALEYGEEALLYWLKSANREMYCSAKCDVAMALSALGKDENALLHLGECLTEPVSNTLIAGIHLNLGIVYQRLRRYTEALLSFYQALLTAVSENYTLAKLATMVNIASCFISLGYRDTAIQLYDYILNSDEDTPPAMKIHCIDNILVCYLAQGKYERLMHYADMLQAKAIEIGVSDMKYSALIFQSASLRYQKQYRAAAVKIDDVLKYFANAPSRYSAMGNIQKAILYLEKEWEGYNPTLARDCAAQAADDAKISKQGVLVIKAYELLAEAYELLGQSANADSYRNEAQALLLQLTAEQISQSESIDHARHSILQLMQEFMPPAV